jgi:hypothetical protein
VGVVEQEAVAALAGRDPAHRIASLNPVMLFSRRRSRVLVMMNRSPHSCL